jgi:hypothetical protein
MLTKLDESELGSNTVGKATLYDGDLWGYKRIEVKDVSWRFVRYAQYNKAIRMTYTVRGKRKQEIKVFTTVGCLLMDGWERPNPPATFGPPKGDLGARTSRRLSGDSEWESEFQAFLDGYIAGKPDVKILVDCRFGHHDPEQRA